MGREAGLIVQLGEHLGLRRRNDRLLLMMVGFGLHQLHPLTWGYLTPFKAALVQTETQSAEKTPAHHACKWRKAARMTASRAAYPA